MICIVTVDVANVDVDVFLVHQERHGLMVSTLNGSKEQRICAAHGKWFCTFSSGTEADS